MAWGNSTKFGTGNSLTRPSKSSGNRVTSSRSSICHSSNNPTIYDSEAPFHTPDRTQRQNQATDRFGINAAAGDFSRGMKTTRIYSTKKANKWGKLPISIVLAESAAK
jgi:hypothetical protein